MKKLFKFFLYTIIAILWFYFLLFVFAFLKDTRKDGWVGDSDLIVVQDIPSPPRLADRPRTGIKIQEEK